MFQITNSSLRAYYYDEQLDDYFYKDTNQVVPSDLRNGFNTTIFKKSNSRRVDLETSEKTSKRRARAKALKAKIQARINSSL